MDVKIAVERRNHKWLAQVVHVDENLHWFEHVVIQNKMHAWVRQNCSIVHINGWQFYFDTEQDLEWFLLRWG